MLRNSSDAFVLHVPLPRFGPNFDCVLNACTKLIAERLRVRLCFIVTCVVVCGLSAVQPPAAHAQQASRAELDRRRSRISALSESDRAELLRKYQAFQNLPESEQNKLRDLHQKIEANAALKETLYQYSTWLRDLDVGQREQLRSADTPEKKRLVVDRIRQDQKRQQAEQSKQFEPRDRDGRPSFPQLASSNELKELMDVLESIIVRSNFDPAQVEQVKKLTGTLRYKRLFQIFSEMRHGKQKEEGGQRFVPIPDELREALLKIVPKPIVNKAFEGGGSAPVALLWLMASLQEEARREFSDSEGDELRQNLFKSLSTQKQSEFVQSPPAVQALYLKRTHMDELRSSFIMAFDMPKQFSEKPRPFRDGRLEPRRDGHDGEGNRREEYDGPRGPRGFREGPPSDDDPKPRGPGRKDPPPDGQRPREERSED